MSYAAAKGFESGAKNLLEMTFGVWYNDPKR